MLLLGRTLSSMAASGFPLVAWRSGEEEITGAVVAESLSRNACIYISSILDLNFETILKTRCGVIPLRHFRHICAHVVDAICTVDCIYLARWRHPFSRALVQDCSVFYVRCGSSPYPPILDNIFPSRLLCVLVHTR